MDNNKVDQTMNNSYWCYIPDSILVQIFKYLDVKELLNAGLVCQTWYRVSLDEFIWKDLFKSYFKIDKSVGLIKGRTWRSEYKRLRYHTPFVQTEVLHDHQNQVLHVSFSYNGKYFATCSKDGYVMLWESSYPARIKYYYNMKDFCWKYTQYSQFNSTDTLLLVSGVHFGTPHTTSGEIAVFNIDDGFSLQCRVVNRPYDIFGTWYTDEHLLSGDLHWLAHLVSSSVLWMNKANQETSSEHAPVTAQLFKFYNTNASSIRSILVANCVTMADSMDDVIRSETDKLTPATTHNEGEERREPGNPPSHRELSLYVKQSLRELLRGDSANGDMNSDYASPIKYNMDYRRVESQANTSNSYEYRNDDDDDHNEDDDVATDNDEIDNESTPIVESVYNENCDKILIFTTGSKTYTPHEIGFKRLKPSLFPQRLERGPSIKERMDMKAREDELKASNQFVEPNWLDYESVAHKFDKTDHLIDLHGHIIGMRLSPDHRFLYVNSRPWPQGYTISNPLDPPPIAQEIDLHVIDLVTMKHVGRMLRAHKAYTPNNECFFIFLDVSHEYVASGAEDKHGYLWDRHYGVCLAKFPHLDVVNSVAFNPKDPEMLVTTSDDYTIKVWRSKNKIKELNLNINHFSLATDLIKK